MLVNIHFPVHLRRVMASACPHNSVGKKCYIFVLTAIDGTRLQEYLLSTALYHLYLYVCIHKYVNHIENILRVGTGNIIIG